jgi:uncharacterized protein
MFVADDVVIYRASDLAARARCEYALLARTAQLGDRHEQRHLHELRGRL